MTKISISIRLNNEQNRKLEEFKQFLKDTHDGAFRGIYADTIIRALSYWIQHVKKEKGFYEIKKNRLETENKVFLSHFSENMLYIIHEDNGLPLSKIKEIISLCYVGVSAPTFRDKMKTLLTMNNWQIIKDNYGNEWVLHKHNYAGKDYRRGELDKIIESTLEEEKEKPFTDRFSNDSNLSTKSKTDSEALDFLDNLKNK